jgi:hypothetical protein
MAIRDRRPACCGITKRPTRHLSPKINRTQSACQGFSGPFFCRTTMAARVPHPFQRWRTDRTCQMPRHPHGCPIPSRGGGRIERVGYPGSRCPPALCVEPPARVPHPFQGWGTDRTCQMPRRGCPPALCVEPPDQIPDGERKCRCSSSPERSASGGWRCRRTIRCPQRPGSRLFERQRGRRRPRAVSVFGRQQ